MQSTSHLATPVSAIDLQGLVKRYGKLEALRGVNLQVSQGEFFGLLGPNGAGKTTLISILAGLVRATEGTAKVMGYDVVNEYRHSRYSLGVVPQEMVFDPFFTVRETLRIQSGYFGLHDNEEWINEVMENLGLMDKADTNMRTLSGGMKRRVLVAQSLMHKPPVIVLDEPTAGVDVSLRQTLWKFVKELNRSGHTIILTTHYLEEAESLCDRLAILREGQILALDKTTDLLQRHAGVYLRLKISESHSNSAIPSQLLKYTPEISAGVVRFRLSNYEEIETILAGFREAGITFSDLQIQAPDLEDVFVDLMANAKAKSTNHSGSISIS